MTALTPEGERRRTGLIRPDEHAHAATTESMIDRDRTGTMSRTTDRLGQIKARNDFMLKTWKYGVAGASRKTADLLHEDDVPGMLGALRNVLAECDDVERRQGTDAASVNTATIRRRIEESLIVGQR